MDRRDDLDRIRRALLLGGDILRAFHRRRVRVRYKAHGSPVTEADLAADEAIRRELPRADESWLSEESADDPARLARRRVWIVDPLDGTREFLEGVPDWCVSIGLAEDGVAVAGGVYAPAREELYLGSPETGATLNDRPVAASDRATLEGAVVLVNRWALRRPGGRRLEERGFHVRAVGPLAYTLALVAAGRADATWSPSSKAEWDIAAGVALVVAAGGHASDWRFSPLGFNRWPPRTPGLVACGARLAPALRELIASDRPGHR